MIKYVAYTVLTGAVLSAGLATEACAQNPQTQAPSGNTSPVGGTLRVWSSSTAYADFTVTNERFIDGSPQVDRVDVTVTSHGDTNSVGDFTAQNAGGLSVDQLPPHRNFSTTPPTMDGLDWSGTMTNGEVRTGHVDFPILGTTEIVLHEGIGPAAGTWSVK